MGRTVWIVAWLLAVIAGVLLYSIDRTGVSRVLVLGVCGCLFFLFGRLLDRPRSHP